MITLADVNKSFQGETLLSELSLVIQKGDKCGIIGRNGSGKTTLFRLILGQEEPDQGKISKIKDYQIGYLNQHILFSKKNLLDEACLALSNKDSIYLAEKVLFGLGFKEEDLQKDPAEFSGGFQLRLHLAKALIAEPDCLLLDEPTNYLDIFSINWLKRFLAQWKGELMIISHDRDFLDSTTNHTIGIHRQKLIKIKGDVKKYYDLILSQEEIHEKTLTKIEKKKEHLQSYIDRFGKKASKASQAQSKLKAIQRLPSLSQLAELQNLDFQFKEDPSFQKIMIQGNDLHFSYSSSPLISNFTLEIENKERIAIIGKNGKGKSTLLKLLLRELEPQTGAVKHGEKTSIGYFGQTHIEKLDSNSSIEEIIKEANHLLSNHEVRSIAGAMMFGGEKATKKIMQLSGGERSRTLLGKILATPCNVLMLDEPTHHLDMESVEALIDAIHEFSGTVLLVTHSELLLDRIPFDRLIICEEKSQKIFHGSYRDFLEKGGFENGKEEEIEKPLLDSKSLKQKRAEVIQKRSKALLPIKKGIDSIEEKIILLEEEIKKQHEDLIQATLNSASSRIQELSKEVCQKEEMLSQLYQQLEPLYLEHEKLKEEFDKELTALES